MTFPPQLGVTYGSQGQIIRQDVISRDLTEIDAVHRRIHDGVNFETSDLSTGINIATPKRFLIITPNTTTRAHLIFAVETQPGATVEFFEDATVTANGTALAAINLNRVSANVATVQVFEDPTVTADGTLLFIRRSGTGVAGGRVIGDVQHRDEFILKQNANYQLKITVLANNTDVSTDISWYEAAPP